jgi:hypothetical protein
MESFYKKWLEKNQEENLKVQNVLRAVPDHDVNILQPKQDTITNAASSSNQETEHQNSSQPRIEHPIDFTSALSNIIFEEGNLQLSIEKGNHIKQRKFRLEDHLFYLKMNLKNPNLDVPF